MSTQTNENEGEHDEVLKCWICFGTSEDAAAPGARHKWRSPCECNLVAHEECLLKWVGIDNDSKPCPQCNYDIHIVQPRSYAVKLYKNIAKETENFLTELVEIVGAIITYFSFLLLQNIMARISLAAVFPPEDLKRILYIDAEYLTYIFRLRRAQNLPGMYLIPSAPYISVFEMYFYAMRLSKIPNLLLSGGVHPYSLLARIFTELVILFRRISGLHNGRSKLQLTYCCALFVPLYLIRFYINQKILPPLKRKFQSSSSADAIDIDPIDVGEMHPAPQENTERVEENTIPNNTAEADGQMEISTSDVKDEQPPREPDDHFDEPSLLSSDTQQQSDDTFREKSQPRLEETGEKDLQNNVRARFLHLPKTLYIRCVVPSARRIVYPIYSTYLGIRIFCDQSLRNLQRVSLVANEPNSEATKFGCILLPLASRLMSEILCFVYPPYQELVPHLFVRCCLSMCLIVILADGVNFYADYLRAQQLKERRVLDFMLSAENEEN